MEKLQNKKVHGLYKGNLNIKVIRLINQMDEFNIWRLIYSAESELFWKQHETTHFEEDQQKLKEMQYALEYLIYQTKRFGVEFPNAQENKCVEKNESYNRWFEHWHNFIFSMDIQARKKFIESKNDCENYRDNSSHHSLTYQLKSKKR